MAHLGTSPAGLPSAEAEARLEQYGLNEVAHEKQKSALRHLAELFATPLSILLLALALVNYETGEVRGAIVIAAMVVLSSLLSFVQEYRSSKAAERLRAMVSTTATVTRQIEPDDESVAFARGGNERSGKPHRDSTDACRAGQRSSSLGGRHTPCGCAHPCRKGSVRESGVPDRRVAAGREVRRAG